MLAGILTGGLASCEKPDDPLRAVYQYTAVRVDPFAEWIDQIISRTVNVEGTDAGDRVTIDYDPNDANRFFVTLNGSVYTHQYFSAISTVRFEGGKGEDVFRNNTAISTLAYGGPDNDHFFGGGMDSFYGEGGSDELFGGMGNDFLRGGDKRDFLHGDAGSDHLWGGGGDDKLDGGTGENKLYGEAGDDEYLFSGTSGERDEIYLGDGCDILDFHRLSKAVQLDLARAGWQDVVGAGLAVILSRADAVCNVVGTSRGDTILGNAANNVIRAGDGPDRVDGRGGDDQSHGESGNDTLWGGDGKDRLYGDLGSDRIYGGADEDEIHGGDEKDFLFGGSHADRIFGEEGDDELYGEAGKDYLWGGSGADQA